MTRRRIRRQRLGAAIGVLAAAAAIGLSAGIAVGRGGQSSHAARQRTHHPKQHRHRATPARPVVTGPPSSRTRLRHAATIGGRISPKSVDASQRGLVFAQNMMYQHTITVYNRSYRLVKTISDAVRLSRFGVHGHPGVSRGAPVELAFTPDGRYAYASNYSMYGAGFGGEGTDTCYVGQYGPSFVYRIDVAKLKIDDAIEVGAVPKYVAVTPDGRFALVTNWCSYSVSVVSTRLGRQVKQISLGPYPRGIAVDPSSHFAYIAVMGSTNIARLDLRTWKVRWIYGVGSGPRHLVISPKGRWLYSTLNGEGTVAKIDLRTDRVVAKVSTGSAPRSMAISSDGTALYVVNYDSNTVAKLRTGDMHVIQTVATNTNPIGITYDGPARTVWVACYTGSIMVFKDS